MFYGVFNSNFRFASAKSRGVTTKMAKNGFSSSAFIPLKLFLFKEKGMMSIVKGD